MAITSAEILAQPRGRRRTAGLLAWTSSANPANRSGRPDRARAAAMKSEQEDSLWFGTTLCFIVALLTIIVFSA